MTDITSPTVRRTRNPFVRYGADAKRLIVTLHQLGPEDAISVRLERRRSGQTILVADLYALLVRKAAVTRHMQKIGKKRSVARKFARLTGK